MHGEFNAFEKCLSEVPFTTDDRVLEMLLRYCPLFVAVSDSNLKEPYGVTRVDSYAVLLIVFDMELLFKF